MLLRRKSPIRVLRDRTVKPNVFASKKKKKNQKKHKSKQPYFGIFRRVSIFRILDMY